MASSRRHRRPAPTPDEAAAKIRGFALRLATIAALQLVDDGGDDPLPTIDRVEDLPPAMIAGVQKMRAVFVLLPGVMPC